MYALKITTKHNSKRQILHKLVFIVCGQRLICLVIMSYYFVTQDQRSTKPPLPSGTV